MGKKHKEFEVGDLVQYIGYAEGNHKALALVVGIYQRTVPIKFTMYRCQWLTNDKGGTSTIQGVYLQKVEKNT